jgi:DNA polymerase-1
MSAFGLAKQLHVERKQAQKYIDQYFAQYPGVAVYMERTREFAREYGFVETVFGRRLYVPDIKAKNHNARQYAERTAINAPMQGTAADIIKRAMIDVDRWLQDTKSNALMIMQVHDELVFEIDAAEADKFLPQVCKLMQNVGHLDIPLVVDAAKGDNWSAAH